MAAIEATKGAPAQKTKTRGQNRRHSQCGTSEERRYDCKSCRSMVQRDAQGGGDAAQGQIHHLRSQREKISKGHTQSVPDGWTGFEQTPANTRAVTELPKWTRVSQRLNPPGF